MTEETRTLEVTKAEAEILMDKVSITNPTTHDLALKLCGICTEFAARTEIHQARVLLAEQAPATYDYGTRAE